MNYKFKTARQSKRMFIDKIRVDKNGQFQLLSRSGKVVYAIRRNSQAMRVNSRIETTQYGDAYKIIFDHASTPSPPELLIECMLANKLIFGEIKI
ncbi:MAG: hypothetical protein WC639_02015 [Patescibacteria group bacterium]|jgi:hypothetical protein